MIQLNVIRCFILPVAFGVFLSVMGEFFVKRNNVGVLSFSVVLVFSQFTTPSSASETQWPFATSGLNLMVL